MEEFDLDNWGECDRCRIENIPICNGLCEDCWNDKINRNDVIKEERKLYDEKRN